MGKKQNRVYTWSGDDRLMAVAFPGDVQRDEVGYSYDHEGTRVGKAVASAKTAYLTDYRNLTGYGQTLSEESSAGGLRNYVYGQDHLALAQTEPGGAGAAFLHGDHLGTTRQLTDPAGDGLLASPMTYSPFGDPEDAGLSSLTNLAFTGQHRDTETALQYHRARWLESISAWRGRCSPVFTGYWWYWRVLFGS